MDGHQQETLSANIASSHTAIQDDADKTQNASPDISSLTFQISFPASEPAAAITVREKETNNVRKSEAESTGAGNTHARDLYHSEENKSTLMSVNNVVAVLTAVVDAAAFSGAEKQKLVAPVLSRHASDDDDLCEPTI